MIYPILPVEIMISGKRYMYLFRGCHPHICQDSAGRLAFSTYPHPLLPILNINNKYYKLVKHNAPDVSLRKPVILPYAQPHGWRCPEYEPRSPALVPGSPGRLY